jgi:GAF domain-containing protein
MCVPLLHEEKALGILNVLDRASQFTLEEMELLGLFANQAAIALDLLQRARRAQAVLAETGDSAEALARVAALLEGESADAGRKLLGALEDLLRPQT